MEEGSLTADFAVLERLALLQQRLIEVYQSKAQLSQQGAGRRGGGGRNKPVAAARHQRDGALWCHWGCTPASRRLWRVVVIACPVLFWCAARLARVHRENLGLLQGILDVFHECGEASPALQMVASPELRLDSSPSPIRMLGSPANSDLGRGAPVRVAATSVQRASTHFWIPCKRTLCCVLLPPSPAVSSAALWAPIVVMMLTARLLHAGGEEQRGQPAQPPSARGQRRPAQQPQRQSAGQRQLQRQARRGPGTRVVSPTTAAAGA
jgi:hypothetical protein